MVDTTALSAALKLIGNITNIYILGGMTANKI